MTPGNHTLYSLTLFLALSCLSMWSHRRHRVSRVYRASVAGCLKDEEPRLC